MGYRGKYEDIWGVLGMMEERMEATVLLGFSLEFTRFPGPTRRSVDDPEQSSLRPYP